MPLPVPAGVIVRVKSGFGEVKLAVTTRAALSATEQVASEAVSHPLQPSNVDPLAGLAVSATLVPRS